MLEIQANELQGTILALMVTGGLKLKRIKGSCPTRELGFFYACMLQV